LQYVCTCFLFVAFNLMSQFPCPGHKIWPVYVAVTVNTYQANKQTNKLAVVIRPIYTIYSLVESSYISDLKES